MNIAKTGGLVSIWLKRIALLVAALLVSITLILASAVLWLDEADYKRLLSWGAGHFLDSQLLIHGPLDIEISRNLSLSTTALSLQANDDSYHLSIGKFHASFRLGSYLRTGTFWFNSLELADVMLEARETTDADFKLENLQIPPVVVAQATISNLVFNYQELPPGTLHTIALDELEIGELGEERPVSLRATGLFEGQAFVLNGSSASIAQFLEGREPHPVQLELSSAHINAALKGTITDPLNGRGLDLQLQADIPHISDLVEIVRDDIPPLGSLKGSLTVHGDYAAPRLDAIDLHLQREREVDLRVTGSVADVLGARGLDLQLDGHSGNPEVLSWLLFRKTDRMKTVRLSGRLQGNAPQVALHELDAAAETSDGLRLELKGSTRVHAAGYSLTPADAGLAVQFSAPSLKAVNLAGVGNIPELGPASGALMLALGVDAIGIYKADISIGSSSDSLILLKGDGGYLRLSDAPDLSGVRLQTDIQTADLARLGKQLGHELPALGPARLRGTLVSRGPDLLLQNGKLTIGTQDKAMLLATGMFGTQLRDPTRIKVAMDVDIQASDLARLGEPFDYQLPALGPTRITGRLDSRQSELLFRDVRLEVGAADQPTIRANGRVTTRLHKGSTINVAFDVAVADLVAAFRDRLPGYLGRLEGDAVISDLDGQWGIERFKLASTRTSLYQLNLDGKYDDLINYDKASINSSLVIENPEKLGTALGRNLSGLGSVHLQGLQKIDKGRLSFHGNTMVGSTTGTIELNGHLQAGKPVLGGSFEIPLLRLADFGVGSSGKHVSAEPARERPARPHVFSREPLNTGILNTFDLDMSVSIDQVESDELTIDSIKGELQLHNGQLKVAPLRLVFEGGNTDIDVEIKAVEIPEYRLRVTADDVTLGPLLAQVQKDVPIRGYSNLHLDVHARGHTPHELASSVTGTVNLGLENARIPNRYVELLSADVFGWVLRKSVSRKDYSNLNCVVLAFDAEAGRVESNTLIADGPKLALGGKINLDLGTETLDVVLIPKQKKRFFSSISPVHVKGPMKDPVVEAIPAKAALQEIGTMALLPGVFIPIRAVERLWGLLNDGDKVGDGCVNVDELRKMAEKEVSAEDAANREISEPIAGDKETSVPTWGWD